MKGDLFSKQSLFVSILDFGDIDPGEFNGCMFLDGLLSLIYSIAKRRFEHLECRGMFQSFDNVHIISLSGILKKLHMKFPVFKDGWPVGWLVVGWWCLASASNTWIVEPFSE